MKEEKDIQAIDKLFRQSLEGNSPVPPPSAWENIKLQVPKQKSPAGKWLGSPGGLSVVSAVLLVAVSWIVYKSFLAEPQTSKRVTSIPALIPYSFENQHINADTLGNSDKIHAKANANLAVTDKNNKKYQQSDDRGSENPKVQPSNSKNSVNQYVDKNNKTKNQEVKSGRQSNLPVSIPGNQAPGKKNENPEANYDLNSSLASRQNSKTSKIENGDPVFPIAGNQNMDLTQDTKYQAIEQNKNTSGTIKKDETAEYSIQPSMPSGQDTIGKNENKPVSFNPVSQDKNAPKSNKAKNEPGDPSAQKTKKLNFTWEAAAFGNIGQVYQKERNANLFYGGTVTAGVWYNKWKAGIETGVGMAKYKDYGSTADSMMLAETIITVDTIWHLQDSIPYMEIVIDSVTSRAYYTVTTDYKYTYTYLQIPFYITKRVAAFGKFSLGIKAGPMVGFMISKQENENKSGEVGNGILISSSNKNYTRLDVSWQLHMAMQLRWDVSDYFSISLAPTAIYFINNLYDPKNSLVSKPYGISISGGIVYKFH
ncbi:MAG: hypothetical protein WCI92_15030 [Bacteroidota bacterium]